jgi:hypothetical protein
MSAMPRSSKIHAVVDTNGLPVRLGLTAREQRIASEAIESTGMQLGRTQMKHASSRSQCVGSPTDAGGGAAEWIRERIHNRETSRLLRRSAPANFRDHEQLQMLRD